MTAVEGIVDEVGFDISGLVLRPVNGGPAAASALASLLEGPPGESESALRLFTLRDVAFRPEDPPAAAALLLAVQPRTVQLLSLSVHPALPQDAINVRLIASLADWLRAAGYEHLVTTIPRAGGRALSRLLAAGFEEAPAEGPGALVSLLLSL